MYGPAPPSRCDEFCPLVRLSCCCFFFSLNVKWLRRSEVVYGCQLGVDDEEMADYDQLESFLRTTTPGSMHRFYLLDPQTVCISGLTGMLRRTVVVRLSSKQND